MSLLPSITTSFMIAFIIWGIAIFQPSAVLASDSNVLPAKLNKPVLVFKNEGEISIRTINELAYYGFENIEISGVRQNIALTEVSKLWEDFNNNLSLQNSLKVNPSKVYVYYSKFSSDYERAEVSIGYMTEELKKPFKKVLLPDARFQSLLVKGTYNDTQIQQAWTKIDYRRKLAYVVEVHYINTDNLVKNSELFIAYNEDK